ncbi:MAG: type II toxin-antitoxin system PemK/MazF family toxin [Chloroflexi bacterium]|nr:type II toxin-antitoxin system PemK/MazF family toxin [Chloroflexota bacterium]
MGPGGSRTGAVATYVQGTIVLVPFPFTALSGQKQRPALVVSPDGFHADDLILCAITSQVPPHLSPWEVPLSAADVVERRLPKPSVIQAGKLFTVHRALIRARFGRVRVDKLAEVLVRLQVLFKRPAAAASVTPPSTTGR